MNYKEKIDYSSLSTYIDCPRKFMFQYMMHFRSSRPNIHLIFGSCWHYGLEVVYKEMMQNSKLSVDDATVLSISAFNKLWELEGQPHFPDHDIIFPKNPGNAANMYHAYWKKYLTFDQENKRVMAVESPFTINLDQFIPGLPNYIGRLDLAMEDSNGKIEIIDHKTTKSIWQTTFTGFEMSLQTDGYLTAGHMFYDKIPTMTYSMAVFQKTKPGFHRFHIMKRKTAIEQFLQDLVFYTSEIIHNIDLMTQDIATCPDRNSHINSFHKRPGYACTAYMQSCPYIDLCKSRNNPLLWLDNPPSGYSINEWDPDTHEETMRTRLEEAS